MSNWSADPAIIDKLTEHKPCTNYNLYLYSVVFVISGVMFMAGYLSRTQAHITYDRLIELKY